MSESFSWTAGDSEYGLDAYGQLVSLSRTGAAGERLFEPVGLSWRMAYEDGAMNHAVNSACVTRRSADGANRYTCAIGGLMVTITFSCDAVGACWQASLENRTAPAVDWFELRLRGSWPADTMPICTIPLLAGWMLPLNRLEPGDSLSLGYPVRAAMQWVDLFHPHSGIYFGVHDPLPLLKELHVGCDKDGIYVAWRFTALHLTHGASVALPGVYLVPHTGDWHAGAAIYREWARGYITPPDVPSWYARQPAWGWVGLRAQHADVPWHTTTDLPGISERAAACGVECLQLTAYTEQGHDTLYPDYRVGASLGGDTGMRQAADAIHNAGRRLTIYTNGRIVDPASSLEASQRADWAVRSTPDQMIARETYGDVTFDILCPGAGAWRELLAQRLAYLVKAYGVDGIFIDQVSAAASLPCYASGHEHNAPNEAWACYRHLLALLRSELKALNPDLVLTSEGISDVFGQYLDSQQAHQDWPIPLQPKTIPLDFLFRYTFPEYLLNSGCITPDAAGQYYLRLAHLLGSGFDFGIADWDALPLGMCREMRFALNWHARLHELLRAEPTELPYTQPGMRAILFAAQPGDGPQVVHWAWMPDSPALEPPAEIILRIALAPGIQVRHVHAETPEGSLQVTWRAADNLLVRLPFAELGGMLIEAGTAPTASCPSGTS